MSGGPTFHLGLLPLLQEQVLGKDGGCFEHPGLTFPIPPQVQELQDSLLRLKPFPPPSCDQAGGSGSGSSSSGADGETWGTQVSVGS